jgi:hypothetical protein
MIQIIETNLIMENNIIMDHQSRVVNVNNWNDYIEEIKHSEPVSRTGSLHGYTILPSSKVSNLRYDEYHGSCDVTNKLGESKKLFYRILD